MAWLGGFKSRALRAVAPLQRQQQNHHLYITDWQAINPSEVASRPEVALCVAAGGYQGGSSCAAHYELAAPTLSHGSGLVVVVALAGERGSLACSPLSALEVVLTFVQTHAMSVSTSHVWLLTACARTACDRFSHAGTCGLARSARAEAPLLPLAWIDASMRQALVAGRSSEVELDVVVHQQMLLAKCCNSLLCSCVVGMMMMMITCVVVDA